MHVGIRWRLSVCCCWSRVACQILAPREHNLIYSIVARILHPHRTRTSTITLQHPQQTMADDPLARLHSVKYDISRIRHAFGTPSIACGVLHHGQLIFRHAEGFADVEARRRADADMVYPVASCTKAFVSATCAILVNKGLLSWDKPISSYLPEFKTAHNQEAAQHATLVDLCSHAAGPAPMDHAVVGFHEKLHSEGSSQIRFAAHLPMACRFRSGFVYNNALYGVVGELIRRVCGKSTGAVMKEKIFEPLEQGRTGTSPAEYPPDGNVARGYSLLDNGSLLRLSDPKLEGDSAHAGAGAVRSIVNDMLTWARQVMEAESRQSGLWKGRPFELGGTSTGSGIHTGRATAHHSGCQSGRGEFVRPRLVSPFNPVNTARLQSPNFSLLPDPPVIGRNSSPRPTICHNGALGGFLTAFYTFPETCSAVLVTANSSPSRGDPTDLIAQSLCQELFDMRPRIDLESFALRAATTSSLIWPALCWYKTGCCLAAMCWHPLPWRTIQANTKILDLHCIYT
jgi:CubicO group peptidase (beta-lactamase class C family)